MENKKTREIKSHNLESDLQSLTIGLWGFLFLLGGPVSVTLLIYILFYTRFWFLVVMYLVWMYIDKETPSKGGYKNPLLRKSILWKYYRGYFPAHLIKTSNLEKDKNYLFICHPHGILSMGVVANLGNDNKEVMELFKDFRIVNGTLNMNFHFPIIREMLLSTGTVSVSKESLLYNLDSKKKGNIVTLVVGGAAESLLSKPNEYHLVIKKRMGFVKLALESGCSIVPVITFGEVDIFKQVENPPGSKLYKFQKWLLNVTGVALCLYYGRGFLKRLPFKKELTTVVGEPITVPKITNPSEDDVKRYHTIYLSQLKRLFNEHNKKYMKSSSQMSLLLDE